MLSLLVAWSPGPGVSGAAGDHDRSRREQVMLGRRDRRQGRQQEQEMTDDMMNIKMLSISVPGIPGDDYPILAEIPNTSFRYRIISDHL